MSLIQVNPKKSRYRINYHIELLKNNRFIYIRKSCMNIELNVATQTSEAGDLKGVTIRDLSADI